MFDFAQWNHVVQAVWRLIEEHWTKVLGSLLVFLVGNGNRRVN
jgi:hypothetical protein